MNRSLNSMGSSNRGASRDFERANSRGLQEAKIRSNLQADALRKSNDSAPSIMEDMHEADYHPKINAKHVRKLFEEITQKRREKKDIPPPESQTVQLLSKNQLEYFHDLRFAA